MSSHFDDEQERESEMMLLNGGRGPEEPGRAESTPPGPTESSATEAVVEVATDAAAKSGPTIPSQPEGDIFSDQVQLFMSLMNRRSTSGVHEPPATTPEQELQRMRNMFDNMTSNLNTLIPYYRNMEIPTSTFPAYRSTQELSATPGGPVTTNSIIDSTRGVFDLAENAFNILNALKSLTSPPAPSPAQVISPTSPSRENPPPHSSSSETAVIEDETPNAATPNAAVSLMSDGLTRGFQQNESLLRSTLSQLGAHILSLPEDHPTYNFLQSISGLMSLHLYEVTWEKKHLDFGVTATSLAWSKLEDPKHNFEKVPTLLRNWSYGQRLLAQDTGDGDKLTAPSTLLEEVYKVAKDMETIPDRVKEFLRHELACCLYDRYLLLGDLTCLDATIEHFQVICEGDATSANKTCQLGLAHLHRFYASGNLDDLDTALHHATISAGMHSAADLSHPTMNFDNAAGLHLVALCLEQKFYLQLDLTYLDQAISKCRAALPMLREETPFFVRCKCDLASLLLLRFQSCDDRADLDAAEEELLTALVTETKERNTQMPVRTLLGFVQTIKAETPAEMDEGIQLLLKSRKDYSGPTYIESTIEELVSRAYRHRYNTTPAATTPTDDLHSALHHARLALNKSRETSPRRAGLALDAGQLLMMVFKSDSDVKLCSEAISMFSGAAKAPSALATTKLQAANEWADAAETCHSETFIDALECGLHLLPTIAWVGNSMPVQYRILSSQSSVLASRAAAYAIERGDLEKAVSYLEMGRNVLWTQALQFYPRGKGVKHLADMDEKEYLADYLSRQLHEDVNEINPEQMQEAMEHLPPATFDLLRSLQGAAKNMRSQLVELKGEERTRQDLKGSRMFGEEFKKAYKEASLHNAARRWQTLQQDLQSLGDSLDPSSNSSSPSKLEDLALVLHKGPVVVLNVSGHRCDAIILFQKVKDGEVGYRHVPLPLMTGEDAHEWASSLREGVHLFETREWTGAEYEEVMLVPILQGLWRSMVLPIVEDLREHGDLKERIWWCPTGPLASLPIHAAGPYEGDEPGLPDLIASSYTPSLHSLIRAAKAASEPFRLLAIGQPNTPDHPPLPGAKREMAAIRERFKAKEDQVTILIDEEVTSHRFTKAIPDKTWLHFACHADQDEEYPFHSAFFIHDGPLKLSKLMRLDLTRVQFAMLSACLTSAGDATLPDECIHLAAGMQFTGVRSVIATMWSVADKAGLMATKGVYRHLLPDGGGDPDPANAAKALQLALLDMQKARVPLAYRVPFIHTGL